MFSTRTGLRDRLADVDALFTLLNPDAAAFVRQQSTVATVLQACPVPGLV